MLAEFDDLRISFTARCRQCDGSGKAPGRAYGSRPNCLYCVEGRVAAELPIENFLQLVRDQITEPLSTGSRRTGGING